MFVTAVTERVSLIPALARLVSLQMMVDCRYYFHIFYVCTYIRFCVGLSIYLS